MTKSQLFTQYNHARAAARAGKLDPARVNRALGLVQAKEARPYNVTLHTCNCMDFQLHGKPCKHLIAFWMQYRAEQQ